DVGALVLVSVGSVATATARQDAANAPPIASTADEKLAEAQALFDAAKEADKPDDHADARAAMRETVDRALDLLGGREDAAALELLEWMRVFALRVGELSAAERMGQHVLDVCVRTRSEDRPELQLARLNLS